MSVLCVWPFVLPPQVVQKRHTEIKNRGYTGLNKSFNLYLDLQVTMCNYSLVKSLEFSVSQR